MLTKEILCAYLPYDVKIASPKMKSGIRSIMILRPRHLDDNGTLGDSLYKPLLRPLSSIDLKWFQDNIDPDLEDFRINCEPENNHFSVEVCEKVLGWSAISYEEYQLFLKNHVDIFGLLESGHAIELKEINNG